MGYFPNWSFMEANLGLNPSFAWREIWETQKLLKVGQQWRMGDGKSIKIWRGRLIPSFDILNLDSKLEMEDSWNDTTDTLLDANFRWNEQKIWSIFNPWVTTHILKIKLGETTWPNTRIWSEERFGLFSVKNTYCLIKDSHQNYLGDYSTTIASTHLWKKIWSLKIPHKIKIFLACLSRCSTDPQ